MTTMKVANLGLLVRCYEALHNWRALGILVAGFVLAVLLMALNGVVVSHLAYHSLTAAKLLGGLIALAALLALLAGVNGAGLMLVDQADGKPSRGFSAAFFGGLGVTLQAILCLLALGLALLVVVLVLWLLSFLARIPGIGPAFGFLLAGPTMLVLAFCYAVLAFGVAMMFVALWRGNGMLGSVGRAIDIVVKRPLDIVLHFIVLALLVVPIELFVVGIMAAGSGLTVAMYAGGRGGYATFGMSPLEQVMGAGSSLGAAGISLGIVFAAVAALFALIYLLGTILIFDSLAADTSATSAGVLQAKARQFRQKIEENRPAAPPPVAPAAAGAPGPAPEMRCAQCGASLAPGDRFCGECGSPQT